LVAPGRIPLIADITNADAARISLRMAYFTVTIAESGWVCRHVKYAC
jgi:hypothetical protein